MPVLYIHGVNTRSRGSLKIKSAFTCDGTWRRRSPRPRRQS